MTAAKCRVAGAWKSFGRELPASVEFGYGTWTKDNHPTWRWRPYADASPFNEKIVGTPTIATHSALAMSDLIAIQGGWSGKGLDYMSDDMAYSHPIYFGTAGDPLYQIVVAAVDFAPWWNNAGPGGGYPVAHAPVGLLAAANDFDKHLTIIDWTTGWEYSCYHTTSIDDTAHIIYCDKAGRTRIDGDGFGDGGTIHTFDGPPDVTAAQCGAAAGLIRAEELIAGEIRHALFLSAGHTGTCSGDFPADFTAPAKGSASTGADSLPPDGARIWLDLDDAAIDALDVGTWKKTVLKALHTYGAYICDTAISPGITFFTEHKYGHTAFGGANPISAFAQAQIDAGYTDVSYDAGLGRYWFHLSDSVTTDSWWATHLHVIAP